jgi:hypothetical protein
MELDSLAWKRTPWQKKSPERYCHRGSPSSHCGDISSVVQLPKHTILIKTLFETVQLNHSCTSPGVMFNNLRCSWQRAPLTWLQVWLKLVPLTRGQPLCICSHHLVREKGISPRGGNRSVPQDLLESGQAPSPLEPPAGKRVPELIGVEGPDPSLPAASTAASIGALNSPSLRAAGAQPAVKSSPFL